MCFVHLIYNLIKVLSFLLVVIPPFYCHFRNIFFAVFTEGEEGTIIIIHYFSFGYQMLQIRAWESADHHMQRLSGFWRLSGNYQTYPPSTKRNDYKLIPGLLIEWDKRMKFKLEVWQVEYISLSWEWAKRQTPILRNANFFAFYPDMYYFMIRERWNWQ